MVNQIQLYVGVTMLIALIGLGVVSKRLYDANATLQADLAAKTAAMEKAEENLNLVSEQLIRERMTRQIAEETLQELRDIPNEVYTEELPPSVGNVLRNFRDRMQ